MGTFGFEMIVLAALLSAFICWSLSELKGAVYPRRLFAIVSFIAICVFMASDKQRVLMRRTMIHQSTCWRILQLLNTGKGEAVENALQRAFDDEHLSNERRLDVIDQEMDKLLHATRPVPK